MKDKILYQKFISELVEDLDLPALEQVVYFINEVENDKFQDSDLNFSPREFPKRKSFIEIVTDKLDKDSLSLVGDFALKLNMLNNKEQLVYVLPILKNILNENIKNIEFKTNEPIIITSDYRILLSQFEDLEVDFSVLTKVVYLLFCKNPYGVNINDLKSYESELINIYKNISSLSDFDLMLNSIKELTSKENKAIFTHISRVKSKIFSIMDKDYAQNFIITADRFGSNLKYIPILKNNLNSSEQVF